MVCDDISKIIRKKPYLLWGSLKGPPYGPCDCSKTQECIDLKLLDFSKISRTKKIVIV